MSTITERVAAGAAWLDANRPGWVERIDLDTLDLGDPCRCVLGQDFAADSQGYTSGFDAGLVAVTDGGLTEDGYRHAADAGFYAVADLSDNDDDDDGFRMNKEYRELTDAWRALIRERRAARREPTFDEIAAQKRADDV
jgi:hypothetical protein